MACYMVYYTHKERRITVKNILMSINEKEWKNLTLLKDPQSYIIKKDKPNLEDNTKIFLCISKSLIVPGYIIVDKFIYDFPNEKYVIGSKKTYEEQEKYSKGEKIFFWHISFVKAYVNELPLHDFGFTKSPKKWTYICDNKYKNITKKFIAYVDGSYNKNTQTYGSGVIILDENNKEHRFHSFGTQYSQYWNVAGEVESAILAIKKAKELNCTELVIYHDYEGIGNWPNGYWKTKNDYTRNYVDFVKSCGLKISFIHVKGHSGNKYNELVDDIASEAAGITKKEESFPFHKYTDIDVDLNQKYNENKTTFQCVNLIHEFKKKDKRTFKNYAELKVGGMDFWSNAEKELLEKDVPLEMKKYLKENELNPDMYFSALRWLHRGLFWTDAIKKVLVDEEIKLNTKNRY